MEPIQRTDIKVTPTAVQIIDRIDDASGASTGYVPPIGTITLVQYDPAFSHIIGDSPNRSLLISSEQPFFHEACVYTPSNSKLLITSNGISYTTAEGETQRRIFYSSLELTRASPTTQTQSEEKDDSVGASEESNYAVTSLIWTKMDPSRLMPNGAVDHPRGGTLICAQGNLTTPAGIFHTFSLGTRPLITSYHGTPFNSPNDVVVAKDGAIWFTDPSYGHDQGFRPAPRLPEQVYRYDPATGDVRCVADGFGRPNGICFSPDEMVCYITDTSTSRGAATDDPRLPATIYAYDIITIGGQPQLTNRRVFAFVNVGFPDGIKCDLDGNVYSGCGDGVWVWNKGGLLLGKIATGDWVANFCFGEGGEMFLCNETRVWRVQLGRNVRGALLGVLSVPLV